MTARPAIGRRGARSGPGGPSAPGAPGESVEPGEAGEIGEDGECGEDGEDGDAAGTGGPESDTAFSARRRRRRAIGLAAIVAIVAIQIPLLALAARANPSQIDADAVAYLRAAEHYAAGDLDLAINGYWSPLVSWLAAGPIALGADPLAAGRLVMALSAVVFTLGGFAVLRGLAVPGAGVVAGTAACALFAIVESVARISPDLLLAGLVGLALARLLARDWPGRGRARIAAGVLLGLAFYAKSATLGIGLASVVLIAAASWYSRHARARTAALGAAVTLGVAALVAAPWWGALSARYGRFTVSTAARISHTVTGPRDVERQHPFGLSFAVPAPGRLTVWEDPSAMPYRPWSPFASGAYLRHQIGVITTNARLIAGYLWAMDRLHLGVCAAVIAFLLHAPWRRNLMRERWRWAGVVLLGICAVYLPTYALGARYYAAAFPLLFAAAWGVAWSIARRAGDLEGALGVLGPAVVLLSFAWLPARALPGVLGRGAPTPLSMVLAARLERAEAAQAGGVSVEGAWGVSGEGVSGGASGEGVSGGGGALAGDTMEGLLTSYFARRPFYGGFPAATPEEYRASGAEVVIAHRAGPIAPALAAAGFENLDPVLFASPDEAAACPLQLFRVAPAPGAGRAATVTASEDGAP